MQYRDRYVVPFLIGILAPIALSAPLVSRADDSPVTLKYVYKLNDTQRDLATIKATVAGMDVVIKQTQKRQVKEVKDNGDVTVLITDEGGTLTLNGTDQHQDPGPDITVKRDKTGKLTDWKPAMDINGAMSPEVLRTTAQLYSVIFPPMAIKEKDAWKLSLDNPIYDKMKIKIESTYVGIEKLDGVDVWKIKQTATVPTNGEGGVCTFDGTFWLNPATGQTVKMDGTVKDVPSQFGNITFTVVVVPVKDDKPAPATADKKAPN